VSYGIHFIHTKISVTALVAIKDRKRLRQTIEIKGDWKSFLTKEREQIFDKNAIIRKINALNKGSELMHQAKLENLKTKG